LEGCEKEGERGDGETDEKILTLRNWTRAFYKRLCYLTVIPPDLVYAACYGSICAIVVSELSISVKCI
tara:strand:+ start:3233 stop:3436 length:204 start_codon:yes stop_codon:yes gene_type:complete